MTITDAEIQTAIASAPNPEFADKLRAALALDGYSVEGKPAAPPIMDREARVANWSRLSDEQATRAINALLEAGVDEKTVRAAAEADGFTMPTIKADTRSEDQIAFDKSPMAPAASLTDYQIEGLNHPSDSTDA